MITTALDANVVLDVLTGTPAQSNQSATALRAAKLAGPVSVSIVVYAEIASNFLSRTRADDFLHLLNCRVETIDESTAFLAGQFFQQYRVRGGSRTRILPDFLIAAHAQLHAGRILTRDKRFFGESFPKLKAVSPEDLL